MIVKAWQSRFTVYRHSISCFACGRAVIIHISYRKCYYVMTSFYTMQETTNQLDHHRPRNYAAIAAGDLNRANLCCESSMRTLTLILRIAQLRTRTWHTIINAIEYEI